MHPGRQQITTNTLTITITFTPSYLPTYLSYTTQCIYKHWLNLHAVVYVNFQVFETYIEVEKLYAHMKRKEKEKRNETQTYLLMSSKQDSHTLTSLSMPNLGMVEDLLEQSPQNTWPHARQWCWKRSTGIYYFIFSFRQSWIYMEPLKMMNDDVRIWE